MIETRLPVNSKSGLILKWIGKKLSLVLALLCEFSKLTLFTGDSERMKFLVVQENLTLT
jgi:hypothetical protein